MYINGIETRRVNIDVSFLDIIHVLKEQALRYNISNNNIDSYYIKDNKIMEDVYYHGSIHDEETVTDDPIKVKKFKAVLDLEKVFKEGDR